MAPRGSKQESLFQFKSRRFDSNSVCLAVSGKCFGNIAAFGRISSGCYNGRKSDCRRR